MLTWKIMEAPKASVLYIYIDNSNLNSLDQTYLKLNNNKKQPKFFSTIVESKPDTLSNRSQIFPQSQLWILSLYFSTLLPKTQLWKEYQMPSSSPLSSLKPILP